MNKLIGIGLFVVAMLSMTAASAAPNETAFEDKFVGFGATVDKEYKWGERIGDRVELWFTWKAEQKAVVLAKIEQKREYHYNHLVMKGKLEQAEKYQMKHQLKGKGDTEFDIESDRIKEQIQKRVQEHKGKSVENKTAEVEIK